MILIRVLLIYLSIITLGICSNEIGIIKNKKKTSYYSFIPGLGQIKNKKWIKSVFIVSLEALAINNWSKNAKIYEDYDVNNSSTSLSKNRYLEKRNKYAWWIGIIYFYSMIDAIVDGHFYEFENVMNSPIENQNVEIKEEDNE